MAQTSQLPARFERLLLNDFLSIFNNNSFIGCANLLALQVIYRVNFRCSVFANQLREPGGYDVSRRIFHDNVIEKVAVDGGQQHISVGFYLADALLNE